MNMEKKPVDFLECIDAHEIESSLNIEDINLLYLNALYNNINGNSEPMKRFRMLHPEYYDKVNKSYHKRSIIKENIKAMKMISKDIVWGALTFDEEHDKASIPTKRKQVLRQLNKYFVVYLFVEEFGELNGRYHVHYIGVLKNNVLYLDFISNWHSRCDIQKVLSMRRIADYLTDYMTKQAPRIRRSKDLVRLYEKYKKSNMWRDYGFKDLASEEVKNAVINLVFDL